MREDAGPNRVDNDSAGALATATAEIAPTRLLCDDRISWGRINLRVLSLLFAGTLDPRRTDWVAHRNRLLSVVGVPKRSWTIRQRQLKYANYTRMPDTRRDISHKTLKADIIRQH